MSGSVSGQDNASVSDTGSFGPTIQVSSKDEGGEYNPVFVLDEDQFSDADLITFDQRVSSRLGIRRASYDPSSASLLTVPSAGRRRHSLSSSHSQDLTTFHGGDGFDEQRRDSSVSIDHLYMPQVARLQPPASPGAFSVQSNWSELIRLKDRQDSIGSFHSVASQQSEDNMSGLSSAISSKIISLVRKFSTRTDYFKEKTIQPPTPTSEETRSVMSVSTAAEEGKPRQHRLASYIPPISRLSGTSSHVLDGGYYIGTEKCRIKIPKFLKMFDLRRTIDPTSGLYTAWLMIVTLAYTYNAAAIPLRAAFITAEYAKGWENVVSPDAVIGWREAIHSTVQVCENNTEAAYTMSPPSATATFYNETTTTLWSNLITGITCYNKTITTIVIKERIFTGYETDNNRKYWWIMDYLADLVYILDILLVKLRIRFVKDGLMEKDRKQCRTHYTSSLNFRMDLWCLFPLDLLYFIPQLNYCSLVRLPRLLKIQTFWEFYDRMDQSVKNAHMIRVMRTLTYMLFLIHIETCGYFSVSAYEGIGINEWVYSGEGMAYVRCLYLATKTATSIGNNPKPKNEMEWLFMTVYWLSGVFVFAMLIGQIRDIFQAANAAKTNFRDTMDKTLNYLQSMNVPKELQDKVRLWFNYNWKQQKTLNENSLLEALPSKMKADMAIHVHFEILSKVTLFQDCDKALLFDLVLKLNPVLYLPGDYICLKGEVGTEMYIVMAGQVEVVGGETNNLVFATLHEGSVFGEISLLAVGGGNRRTANVRSKGYSHLFILSKADFEEAMTDYPEAQKILKRKAKKLLNKNKKTEEESKIETQEIIQNKEDTPKMLKTVVQVINPSSKIHDYLKTHRTSFQVNEDKMDGQEPIEDIDAEEEEEEDEILVIEQIERPISEAELKKYADRDILNEQENWRSDAQSTFSDDSVNTKVAEILEPTPPPQSLHKPSDVIKDNDEYNELLSFNEVESTPVIVSIESDDENKESSIQKINKEVKITHTGFGNNKVTPGDTLVQKSAHTKTLQKATKFPHSLPSISVLDPAALLKPKGKNTQILPKEKNSKKGKQQTPGTIHTSNKAPFKSNKVGIANPDTNVINVVHSKKSTGEIILKSDSVTTGNKPVATSSFDKGQGTVYNVPMENIVECDVEVHCAKGSSPAPTVVDIGFENDAYDTDV